MRREAAEPAAVRSSLTGAAAVTPAGERPASSSSASSASSSSSAWTGRPAAPRAVLLVATAAYLAFIGWVTLGPQPYDPSAATVLDRVLALLQGAPVTSWITFDIVEFTANIALFVPLGVLLVLVLGSRSRWLALALSVALTCGIELAQGAWLPTRVSDLRDVVANSAGAALGIVLLLADRRFRGGRERMDR
jgi:glycopeptide antibiotics resistance protein